MSLAMGAIVAAAALQTAGTASPAPANPAATADGPSNEERIADAASLGRLLYLFDQAAWVSSDALTAAVPKDRLAGVGGYVIEMPDRQTMRVTYYRGEAAAAQAFFVADVQAGKVLRHELLATPVALTAEQARLARARDVGVDRARAREYRPCTPAPFNTVVVPSRPGGPIMVYLLTAQQDAASYPMGGNYRVIVGPDGSVLASRPYSVSCINLTAPKLPAGAKPVGFTVTHLLDPVPTELHVLASYRMRSPLIVAASAKSIWTVRGSTIAPAKVD